MTLHKISAGDGYTYLTRQVATGDTTDRAHDSLAAYYGNRGESPGRWTGRLAEAINVTGPVTEAQMLALFGEGRHPNAARIEQAIVAAGRTPTEATAATQLGRPFPVYDVTSQFPTVLAKAYSDHNVAHGRRARAPIDDDTRAVIRTRVAREMFTRELSRPPADSRELSGWIARNTRPDKVAIAGYDLTFSPAKSVSVLWALAPRDISQTVAAAHNAAVATVVDRIEAEAAYTRQGARGVRQVKVEGVIAAAFTHRSSRAGDPDLHTHVTVASKVQAPDGSWLSLDGRMLYKGNVTYSEMYNTALETELVTRLPGLRFVDVARTGPGGVVDSDKRPVRELAGLDPLLLSVLSKRAAAIEPRRAELAARFVAEHGRTPTRSEQLALAQQATLDTRTAKKEQRTHAEERAAWRAEAVETVGPVRLARTIADTLDARRQATIATPLTREQLRTRASTATLAAIADRRAVWQEWHVRAEAQRQVRPMVDALVGGEAVAGDDIQLLVDQVVQRTLQHHEVIALGSPDAAPLVPDALRNPDGRSQYDVFRAATFTTTATLAAESRIVATAGRRDGRRADPASVDTAVLESHANGKTLNTGQAALVRELATSGARFQLALAPAGSGKTTAMKALARAWETSGGTVVGLAPSAAAASELAASIGQRADTVDKLVHELDRATADPKHRLPRWIAGVDAATLILVDEVSLASTRHLDRVLAFAVERGASVRGVGDPAQRASVAAGGVMRDVETAHGAVSLAEVMRFTDPTEGAASLALRDGDPAALGHYLDHGRIHVGDLDTALAAVYNGWADDRGRGVDTVMLAPLRDQVASLNLRARADRLAAIEAHGATVGRESALALGQHASVGDLIQTRRNDRTLTLGATDFVRNGYRYHVDAVREDGSILARHLDTGRRVALPTAYLAAHTELGYARTIAAAQGMTAGGGEAVIDGVSVRVEGTAHILVDPKVMDCESFYVAMTRGTAANHAYVVAADRGDEHAAGRPDTIAPATAAELLAQVLDRTSVPISATSEAAAAVDPFRQLGAAAAQYADALRIGAADLLGPVAVDRITLDAERVVPGVTEAPAWSTLRGHLALIELDGQHHDRSGAGTAALAAAAESRDLTGATDIAAVLDWRLAVTADAGPLPWLPAVPVPLVDDPTWGPFVTHLAARVDTLAVGVGQRASTWADPNRRADSAPWARQLVAAGAHERSLARLAVWRAAHEVLDDDIRPTGPPVLAEAERTHQRDLDRIAAGYGINATADATAMTPLAERVEPRLLDDPYWPQLATRLRAIERAGIDVAPLAYLAHRDGGPLPDEQAAAALWWRLSRHLAPNVAAEPLRGGVTARPTWSADLDHVLGPERAEAVLTDVAWPALMARIDAAARDGHDPAALLDAGLRSAQRAGVSPGELTIATLWHVSLLADPPPPFQENLPPDPADLDLEPPSDYQPEPDREPEWAQVDEPAPDEAESTEIDPFVGGSHNGSALGGDLWPLGLDLLSDLSASSRVDLHGDLPPAERVAALTADLTAARAELAALTQAVMTDRGPHVTAVMPQVIALRRRADELAPLVADRDYARADWLAADAALADAERALTAHQLRNVASSTTDPFARTLETVMEQHVEYAQASARSAYDDLVAADRTLESAGDGDIVLQTDATEVWRCAADLDVQELNTCRTEVSALQDVLWRATLASSRFGEVARHESRDALFDASALDYGALAGPELRVDEVDAAPALDVAPVLGSR